MPKVSPSDFPIGHAVGPFLVESLFKIKGYPFLRLKCQNGHLSERNAYSVLRRSAKICKECIPKREKPKSKLLTYPKIEHKSEYQCWQNIKKRCLNPKTPNYQHYGGRGITIWPDWVVSFDSFMDHVGKKPNPSVSLDRIDNDGNYEPGNVRWATYRQQAANQRPPQRGIAIPCSCAYTSPQEMLWHF